MDNNTVVSAPQIADAVKYYKIWKQNNTGSFRSFLKFMVTSSPERDSFVSSQSPETVFNGPAATVTLL